MFDLIGIIFFAWAIADAIQGTGGYNWHLLLAFTSLITSYTVKAHTEIQKIRKDLENEINKKKGNYIEDKGE